MLLSRSTQQQHAKDWRGRTPLHLAAQNGHYEMVSLLIAQGSNINVMDQSPAPIETAVKLSALYRDMSEKEKERAKDLLNVAVFSENMAVELLGITATEYNAALLLKAKTSRKTAFGCID
uniref:ANK_REP_REGION domain-containing protein n=1 Tax=Caenorhabditis japonica TaxID=281687 RepID=A0A8R1IZB7_CAEJA